MSIRRPTTHEYAPDEVRRRLETHLREWLGSWPPRRDFEIVESERRATPGWDGLVHRVIGVDSPMGTVLSVPPGIGTELGNRGETQASAARHLGLALGMPGGNLIEGTFRWSERPADVPDAGVWLPQSDSRIPAWLLPFGSPVLVALDEDGSYMGGVGIKRHDPHGHEIAVVTDSKYRGRGLARLLVAQAARQILEVGAVPTYLHDDANVASGHVADAAGFPDRGWRILGFWETGE